MSNNVIQMPETQQATINRINRKYEMLINKHYRDVKKLNWFAGGFLFGTIMSLFVFSCVYYFSC